MSVAALALDAVLLLMAVVLSEQAVSRVLRWWRVTRDPLVSAVDETLSYERSIATLASPEVRLLWAGLLGCCLLAGLALTVHELFWMAAAPAWAWSLAWDLRTWELVAVSPWQVAWRRGWRRSIRRLPMHQVARVHLVERELAREFGAVGRLGGTALGSCYLALELHNGRAIKLPRTALWWGGRERVAAAAQFVRRRQRLAERERIASLREQARALQRARRLIVEGASMRLERWPGEARELRQRERALRRQLHRLQGWPGHARGLPPDTAPDAIHESAPVALGGAEVGCAPPPRTP